MKFVELIADDMSETRYEFLFNADGSRTGYGQDSRISDDEADRRTDPMYDRIGVELWLADDGYAYGVDFGWDWSNESDPRYPAIWQRVGVHTFFNGDTYRDGKLYTQNFVGDFANYTLEQIEQLKNGYPVTDFDGTEISISLDSNGDLMYGN